MRPTSMSPSLISRSPLPSLDVLPRAGTSTPTRTPPSGDAFEASSTPAPIPDHNCWDPIRWTLNNNADPTDPRIKLGMYDNLREEGILRPLTDVNALAQPNAEQILLAHGFHLESDKDGVKSYVLGNPGLYGSGQRAVLFPDGKVALASFSTPKGGHTTIFEQITRDMDGTIKNDVGAVPT